MHNRAYNPQEATEADVRVLEIGVHGTRVSPIAEATTVVIWSTPKIDYKTAYDLYEAQSLVRRRRAEGNRTNPVISDSLIMANPNSDSPNHLTGMKCYEMVTFGVRDLLTLHP